MTREYDKLEDVRELIEDCIENLARAQGVHRDLTGQQWIPPLRLAPRKRKEAPEPSIRERIGRIQTEIEAIDAQCGDAPDEFTNCVFCVVRDCEEMLLQLEEYEEARI